MSPPHQLMKLKEAMEALKLSILLSSSSIDSKELDTVLELTVNSDFFAA